uniref:Photosystem I subunit O n=1 Tax=Dunaliella tertiolecta TaxID=3047 RepID=A0A7S3QPH5_DUNTE|mmetsp:Transcript_2884/g.7523  ORF Transcript_2884/g.7523 Transcript_2884/m.7523 type:complete len:129 (+) Transcript_2884:76-462(+)|eukprot:CAMPEP_0202343910 /NCGR_PEP_ID=MMETSP1126-20121109/3822_1 /ASSEMBLY_ACC=CAM_ASM_000457 /TAXON_ID=3047 /ORGANISM="Dunaliella tertiolecta, Strain CCMP1320" /LENGTH=128 /DNA_ID=CAMNT_0048935033 /DNA_START=115 /DNA_END=501 /DNA_ORIENTATION=-
MMLAQKSMLTAKSAVARPALPTRAPRAAVKVAASSQGFDRNWLKVDPIVPAVSFVGWTVPSNIGTSALNGQSLFGAFYESIGQNLAHWPTGPALDDKFWLYMVTWHTGLFIVMLLGQVGVQGRKQGYW